MQQWTIVKAKPAALKALGLKPSGRLKRVKVKKVPKVRQNAPMVIRRIGAERDVVIQLPRMLATRARVNDAERHAGIEAVPLNFELANAFDRSNRQRPERPSRRSNVVVMERRSTTHSPDRRYNSLGELGFSFSDIGESIKDLGTTFSESAKQAISKVGSAAVETFQAKSAAKREGALLEQQRLIAEQKALEAKERRKAAQAAKAAKAAKATKKVAAPVDAEVPFYQNPKIMLPVAAALTLTLILLRRRRRR